MREDNYVKNSSAAHYFWLVIKTFFSGPANWFLSLATFASLFVTIPFPAFPLWVFVALVIANILITGYQVWLRECSRALRLQDELTALKNSVPKYVVSVGDIKRYSVGGLIDEVNREINTLLPKKEDENNQNLATAGAALSMKISSQMQQLAKAFEPMRKALGYEDDKDKLERLKNYCTELLRHENRLKDLYKVSLSIESDKRDENVEVEISSADTCWMTLHNEYEYDELPKKYRQGMYSAITLPPLRNVAPANKYYLQTYIDENTAFSELSYINAKRPTNIFGEDYYLRVKDEKDIELKAKVHSAKLSDPQIITIKLALDKAPELQITNTKGEDHE